MPITLDYTNMMTDAVGPETGISDAELGGLQARTREIHGRIADRRNHGELPFFDLPDDRRLVDDMLALAADIRSSCDDVVVLGIGGSALGTSAVFRALRPHWHNLADSGRRAGHPRLFVLDNVDPDGFAEALDLLVPERTLFLVISKSGTTVETSAQFLVARRWVEAAVGGDYRRHFLLITDPERGILRELARQEGYRTCDIPAGVGGRFSVLTAVGLLPLACAGVDIAALMRGAAAFAPRVCHADLTTNPAYLNAALQYLAYGKGQHISVLMPYSDRLRDVADWYRQMWAESLGKKHALDGSVCHVGPTPVRALGTTDQHSQVQLYMEGPFDKVITFLAVDAFDRDLTMTPCPGAPAMDYLAGRSLGELIRMERLATAAALTRNGRPNCTLAIPRVDAEGLGALIYLFEVQTLFAGYLFGVNPLDQPGVEEGKEFTYALMGRRGYEAKGQEYAALQARGKPRVLQAH